MMSCPELDSRVGQNRDLRPLGAAACVGCGRFPKETYQGGYGDGTSHGPDPTRPAAASSTCSLTSVSARSAAGSEPASTPTPAKRIGLAVAQEALRRATQSSPSSVASVHTDPAGVPAAVQALEVGDHRGRRRPAPPTAGVGCSIPASSIAERGTASWAITGVARCSMFATLTISGSAAASTQTACARGADDALGDDPLLAAVLVAAQELLAQMVVDGGSERQVGRPRHGRGAGAGARTDGSPGSRR